MATYNASDFGTGYQPRDYKSVPEFSVFPEYDGARIPRSEWKSLIELHNQQKTMPVFWHKKYLKIQSQSRTNYCWMYGTVAAVSNRYAIQGVSTTDLCAYATAFRGKNGANRGGYGVEACRYIQEFGIPSKRVFPEFKADMSLWRKPEVIEDANRHKLVTFEELGQNDFDGVVSSLLDPVDPSPCTLALNWWGHLVAAVGVAEKGGEFGLIIANSHGTSYSAGGESGGYGILWGKKAVPFESVVVRSVKAVTE